MGASLQAVISAWSTVSPFGIGRQSFVDGLRAGRNTATTPDSDGWAGPGGEAHLVPGFAPREFLGNKGTRSMDRATGLAVATVAQLLNETNRVGNAEAHERTALVLGTTMGSARSIMDFARDGLVSEKPYFVDPARFPNAVMNCATGTCAIWHQLKGPNTTVSSGRLSGLHALKYSMRLLAGGRADTVLCGGVEEFSAARAWIEWHNRHSDGETILGEGCAVMELTAGHSGQDGRAPVAEVLAVELGVAIADPATALTGCLERALGNSSIQPADVWLLVPGTPALALGAAEESALTRVFGNPGPRRLPALFGDSAAASVPFQTVAALATAEGHSDAKGRIAVVSSVDRDGAVGCAVLRIL